MKFTRVLLKLSGESLMGDGEQYSHAKLSALAQAIAQVCELTWQLKGQATGRQVEGATVGITANQGLFGHGSSVIVAR